jgi:hypothetical protein
MFRLLGIWLARCILNRVPLADRMSEAWRTRRASSAMRRAIRAARTAKRATEAGNQTLARKRTIEAEELMAKAEALRADRDNRL